MLITPQACSCTTTTSKTAQQAHNTLTMTSQQHFPTSSTAKPLLPHAAGWSQISCYSLQCAQTASAHVHSECPPRSDGVSLSHRGAVLHPMNAPEGAQHLIGDSCASGGSPPGQMRPLSVCGLSLDSTTDLLAAASGWWQHS